MSRRVVLVSALAALAGCAFHPSGSDQPIDASGDGGVDARVDAPDIDAPIDAAIDGPDIDGPVDAPPIDATVDAAIDAPVDASIDAAIDASVDAPIDAPGPTTRTLVFDTAADFGQGPPILFEAYVDPLGRVAPRAYYQAGLCTGGSNSRLFTDGNTADGSVLPATFRTGLARYTDLNIADNTVPVGVGITDPADWTYWLVGEVYLTQGSHALSFLADDAGFVEIGQIGTPTAFTKVLGGNRVEGEKTATYDAIATGWYGVRYAVSQANGPVELYLKVDGQFVPRWNTRCRADQQAGLAQLAADEGRGLKVTGATIDATTQVVNANWGFNSPTDFGLVNNDNWSTRWSGQLRIDIAGSYTFRLNTDDGQRMWLDGVKVTDAFDDQPHNLTTAPINLSVGWHDLVVEHTENTLGATARLLVNSGPELVGLAIPPSRFRPAEARSERVEDRSRNTALVLPGAETFTLDVPAGALVTGVDVGYRLALNNLAGVTVTLTKGGTTANLRMPAQVSTTDRINTAAFNGLDPSGVWTLTYTTGTGQTGQSLGAWLTVHYTDPPRKGPIAETAALTTTTRDLTSGMGTVSMIGPLRFTALPAVGAVHYTYLRTCATSPCTGAWSGPYASGAMPGVAPQRYVQFLFAISTDTDHDTYLDRVELDYQVMP